MDLEMDLGHTPRFECSSLLLNPTCCFSWLSSCQRKAVVLPQSVLPTIVLAGSCMRQTSTRKQDNFQVRAFFFWVFS